MTASVHVACGCRVDVEHHTGERLVACDGSPDCPGGRRWVVSAEQSTRYFVSELGRRGVA